MSSVVFALSLHLLMVARKRFALSRLHDNSEDWTFYYVNSWIFKLIYAIFIIEIMKYVIIHDFQLCAFMGCHRCRPAGIPVEFLLFRPK
jgi:hypothetical protein